MRRLLCFGFFLLVLWHPVLAQDTIEAVVETGDTLNGSLAEWGRVFYELHVTPGEFFTVRVGGDDPDAEEYILDVASHEYIRNDYSIQIDDGEASVYQAGDTVDTYLLQVNAASAYSVTVEAGDHLREWQPALEPGDQVTGRVATGQILAYGLQVGDIEFYTLRIDNYDLDMRVLAQTGSDRFQNRDWDDWDPNWNPEMGSVEVYRSYGPAVLILRGEGDYTLSLEAGDNIRSWQPPLKPGDTVSGRLSIGETIAYELQDLDSDLITLRYDNPNIYFGIVDTNGRELNDQYYFALEETVVEIYRPSPESHYTLNVTGEGDYSLMLEAGDTIRDWQPPLNPGETLSGVLDDGQYLAVELLLPEEETFTLRRSQDSLYPIINTFDGGPLDSQFDDFDDTSQEWVSIYEGDESVPYTATVQGPGEYMISLEAEDTFRDEQPALALGDIVSGALSGGRAVSYDLNVSENTYFTLVIDNPDIAVSMVDDDSDIRWPLTFDYSEDRIVEVYRVWDAPYNLTLEGDGDYTLSIESGDTFHGPIQALTAGDTLTGTLSGDGEIIYELVIDPTEDFPDGFTVAIDNEMLWGEVIDIDNFPARQLFTGRWKDAGFAGHYAAECCRGGRNWLILRGDGDYAVSLDSGDTLRRFGGVLAPGQLAASTAEAEDLPYVRYDLDVADGEFHTLHITGTDRTWMRDQEGFDVPIQFEQSVLDVATQTYDYYYVYWNSAEEDISSTLTLQNAANAENATVTTELFAEDTLRVDGGTISYGETIEGFTETEQSIRFQLDVEDLRATSPDDEIFVRVAFDESTTGIGFPSLSTDRGQHEIVGDPNGAEINGVFSITLRFEAVSQPEFYTITLPDVLGPYSLAVSKNAALPPATSLSSASSAPDAVDTTTPTVTAASCMVSASANVNQRSGPGTNFEVAGVLTAGESVLVSGQVTAGDGFRWWQLETGAWVRSDVVSTTGDCEAVPTTGS